MSLAALEGFVIGVTADRRWSEQAELLERRGASVLHGATIATQYLACDDALRVATEAVIERPPDYVVATTGIGFRAWFEAAHAEGLGAALREALGASRVAARGPKASGAVDVAGLGVWASPPSERLADVVALLTTEDLRGRVVAFQHYGEPAEDAVAAIEEAGATVVQVPVYRYEPPEDPSSARSLLDAACTRQVDAVTFTSAPAVSHLLALARAEERHDELLDAFDSREVLAACIGPVCAEAARRAGISAPVAPETGRLGLLVRVLTDELQGRRRHLRCGPRTIVVQGRAVVVEGVTVLLTPGERAVLDMLARRPGAVVPKAAMVRSSGARPTSPHALEATVARLRRALGPAGAAVQAVRGRGYRLDAHEERLATG